MSNKAHTLYVGVTSDLDGRVWEHKNKAIDGFTKQYHFTRLVYFEWFADIRDAIAREKQIKGWTRWKKVQLIQSVNPKWLDLERARTEYPGWYREKFES